MNRRWPLVALAGAQCEQAQLRALKAGLLAAALNRDLPQRGRWHPGV